MVSAARWMACRSACAKVRSSRCSVPTAAASRPCCAPFPGSCARVRGASSIVDETWRAPRPTRSSRPASATCRRAATSSASSACAKICSSAPTPPRAARWTRAWPSPMRRFRCCASARASSPRRSPAASSRCSPSRARSWRVRGCCCSTSLRSGWRPGSCSRSSRSSSASIVTGSPCCWSSRTPVARWHWPTAATCWRSAGLPPPVRARRWPPTRGSGPPTSAWRAPRRERSDLRARRVRWHPWQVTACLGGVLLLAAVIAIIPAGRRPFWSSDEARVALLARDALENGRWLVADLRDRQYLNKPQLTYWSVAVSSIPFGRVTEKSAAIPSVIASIAAVAGVIAIGWRLWGWTTGALAGLILATSPLQFDMSHQVLPDMLLSAWLVWALYFFVSAAGSGWSLRPLVGFYLCLTAALLSKGPAALAGVAGAGVAVALTDGPAALRRMRPVFGAAVVLVLAGAVWLVPYHVRSAGAFQGEVITGHYVTWYAVGSVLGRLENLSEPLIVFLPWTVLLAAAPFWWRQRPDPVR